MVPSIDIRCGSVRCCRPVGKQTVPDSSHRLLSYTVHDITVYDSNLWFEFDIKLKPRSCGYFSKNRSVQKRGSKLEALGPRGMLSAISTTLTWLQPAPHTRWDQGARLNRLALVTGQATRCRMNPRPRSSPPPALPSAMACA